MNRSPLRRNSGRSFRQGMKDWMPAVAGACAIFLMLGISAVLYDPKIREGAIRRAALTITDDHSAQHSSNLEFLLEGSIGEDANPFDRPPGEVPGPPPTETDPEPGEPKATYRGFCKSVSSPAPPTLDIQQIWRSQKQRRLTEVSLVTQLSLDRLNALELQCSVWNSVITATIYLPIVNDVIFAESHPLHGKNSTDAIDFLSEFHSQLDEKSRCKLDLILAVEIVVDAELVGLYPVNALRNRALQAAQTDVVFLLDADFIPARGLSEDIHDKKTYEALIRATSARQAIVLPAFQVMSEEGDGQRLALKAVEGKASLRRMMQNHRLQGFHMDAFINGHRATDFERWMDATVAYRLHYEEGFEPYVMVHKEHVPWYDERFRGYRKNKMVHLMHMNHIGMVFVATPKGYVVHVPHTEANTWRVTKKSGYWKKLQRLYDIIKEEMDSDIFVPATGFRCQKMEAQKWSWHRKLLLVGSRRRSLLFLGDDSRRNNNYNDDIGRKRSHSVLWA